MKRLTADDSELRAAGRIAKALRTRFRGDYWGADTRRKRALYTAVRMTEIVPADRLGSLRSILQLP